MNESMGELTLSNPSVFNSLTPYTRALLKLERSMDYSIDVASLKLDMILERKDLELKEAGLKVLVEDGSEDMMDSLYMEAEDLFQAPSQGRLPLFPHQQLPAPQVFQV